jgi:hypothetical protein
LLAGALDGGRFTGNVLGGYVNSRAYQSNPTMSACGAAGAAKPTALVGCGTDDRMFLARKLMFEGNDGFCYHTPTPPPPDHPPPACTFTPPLVSNGGVLQLLGSDARYSPQGTMPVGQQWDGFHIADLSSPFLRGGASILDSSLLSPQNWATTAEGPTVRATKGAVDGQPIFTVCQKNGIQVGVATIFRINLSDFPSLAGQAVYMALQVRTPNASTAPVTFALEISSASGYLTTTDNTTLSPPSGWVGQTISATLAWNGTCSFALRLFGQAHGNGLNGELEVAGVVVVPIGGY